MRILVVDDSKIVRQSIGGVLEEAGYRCDYAENGLEALKCSLRETYRLIITDVNMPVLDGLKFVRRIRLTEKTRDVPVLIITAKRDLESVSKARELGVSGYVIKPVEGPILLKRVKAVLDSQE